MQNYFIFIPSPYPLPEGEGKRKKPENSSAKTIPYTIPFLANPFNCHLVFKAISKYSAYNLLRKQQHFILISLIQQR